MNRNATWIVAAALALMGCATTTGPDITVDYDHSAELTSYKTYGYPEVVGTDRAGYTTLVTKYFKDAINREMQRRGYVYDEADPDLLVNVFSSVSEVTDARRMPYSYPYGLYGDWPLYGGIPNDYEVGTVNIDIVDGERMQVIWQGSAESRITRDDVKNPRAAIDAVVAELFQRFSGVAAKA